MAKFQDRKYPLSRRPETLPAEEATYSDIFKLINTFKSFFIDLDAELENYLTGAPEDGQIYGQQDGDWVPITGGGGGIESIVAGTGITVDNTDPANPVVSATGGGGGSSLLILTGGRAGSSASYRDYTVYGQMPQSAILRPASKIKFSMWISAAGSFKLGAIKVLKTAVGGTTVLDSITVTIGGNAAPTLTPPAANVFYLLTTDDIAVDIQMGYDYWLAAYFDSSSVTNPAIGTLATTSFVLGNFTVGNTTGNTTIPVAASNRFLFTDIIAIS